MINKKRPLVVISSCLLGELVRHNGGHCSDSWIMKELSKHVDFYSICPEVQMNLGTPRDEIHLYYEENDKKSIRLKSKKTDEDLTERAHSTYNTLNKELRKRKIDGFILTKKSPSCGLDGVKTIQKDNPKLVKQSTGLFAQNIIDNFEFVPKIDSGRLNNKSLRENFIKSVFAHFSLTSIDASTNELQAFHRKYKYILMDHSPSKLKALGKIAATTSVSNNVENKNKYYELFFEVMKSEPSNHSRFNTLQHIMGYFKKHLSKDEKALLVELLEDCKSGSYNYLVALKHLELLTNKYKISYLNEQRYFSPYPKGLNLLREI